jgi:hypothetical protein
MRVAGLLLGFGTILVLGLVVSQIGLGFHPRLRSISTMPEPSKKVFTIADFLSQCKRSQPVLLNSSCLAYLLILTFLHGCH